MKTRNFFRIATMALVLVTVSSTFMGCVHEIENITSHDQEIINKYFTPQEQRILNQRLSNNGINCRAVLGQTNMTYYPLYGYECEISLYEAEIRKFYDRLDQYTCSKYNITYENVRDKVLIHELCHVLYPEDAHDTTWRKCFESHLKSYVTDMNYSWAYFYNAYVASYEEGAGYETYRAALPLD